MNRLRRRRYHNPFTRRQIEPLVGAHRQLDLHSERQLGFARLRLQGDLSAEPFAIRVFDTSTNVYAMRLNRDGALTLAGNLTQGSSVHIKEDFEAVDVQDVLDRLVNLPMLTWRYRTEEPGVRHLGPTSQDFMAAFGLGDNPEGIGAVDADGVTMAAIQALHANVEALRTENEALRQQTETLLERLAALEARLDANQ